MGAQVTEDLDLGAGSSMAAFREDLRWMRAVGLGEPAAVRRLVDEAGPIVFGFLFARVGGDEAVAADLLQETFLEAVRSASGFRGESSAATWVCAIARHRIARHFERERRQDIARHGLVLLHGEGEPTERAEGYLDVDRRDQVVRALGTLTPLHRQVLVMKYLDNCSVEEIATDLGKTRVQVQSLLQRARSGLRCALGGSDA